MDLIAQLRQLLDSKSAIIDDPEITISYARDASEFAPFQLPAVVVLPRTSQEVSKVLRFADEHRIPIVTRGAGSGLSGGANAIEGCIVLSLEKMDRIIEIDPVNLLATVEPGVINNALDEKARGYGLTYRPDPASREWSTIGGNVATNAGGMCCVKYGVTAESVRSIKVALADGSIITLGQRAKKSVTGLDLRHLFIGSEGTLGVIIEITVALAPRSHGIQTVMATFKSTEEASATLPELIRLGPSMLEIMDKSTIDAVESWRPLGFENVGAIVIFQSDDGIASAQSSQRVESVEKVMRDLGAIDIAISDDPAEVADLIQIRKLAFPALERLGVALLDDVCVPISEISKLVRGIESIAESERVKIGIFGHGGDGNLHPTIIYPHGDEEARVRAESAFHQIITLAHSLGGTATGEHGVGAIKVDSAAEELGPRVVELQEQIKAIFDPKGILNPGKKLPSNR